MSVPKTLRGVPAAGHGYHATYAEFVDFAPDLPMSPEFRRAGRRMARRMACYMVRWCLTCQVHEVYRASLRRMHAAYGRRTR